MTNCQISLVPFLRIILKSGKHGFFSLITGSHVTTDMCIYTHTWYHCWYMVELELSWIPDQKQVNKVKEPSFHPAFSFFFFNYLATIRGDSLKIITTNKWNTMTGRVQRFIPLVKGRTTGKRQKIRGWWLNCLPCKHKGLCSDPWHSCTWWHFPALQN